MKKLKIFTIMALAFTMTACCGCKSGKSAKASLTDVKWTLVQLQGEAVKADNNFHLTFNSTEGRAVGRGDCNTISGGYEKSGEGKVNFKGMITTRAFCPNQALEDKYVMALNSVDGYSIDGDMLTLLSGGEVVMVMKAEK